MNEIARWTTDEMRCPAAGRTFAHGLSGAVGGLVMTVALAIGAAVALVFAATVAVVVLLATLMLALATLAWRVRPRSSVQRTHIVHARRTGHGWVNYGWERR